MGIDGHFLVGNCRGGGGLVDGEGVVFEPPSVEFACLCDERERALYKKLAKR